MPAVNFYYYHKSKVTFAPWKLETNCPISGENTLLQEISRPFPIWMSSLREKIFLFSVEYLFKMTLPEIQKFRLNCEEKLAFSLAKRFTSNFRLPFPSGMSVPSNLKARPRVRNR